jgi:hypothetical protein
MSSPLPLPATDRELYADLRALMASSFPKRCRNCGREYPTAEAFVTATAPVAAGCSGFKQSRDDDGTTIIELFRNCLCGSTLMDSFDCRRNATADGLKKRQRFDDLLGQLAARGLDPVRARGELLNVMRGQPSDLLALIKGL